ncbi:hypothetical protein A9Q84_06980 [Halobacteriovorax marinus]|uniref:Response regulatory domain-containing protein n=1 Tax=Halobacteriovorax marinus TaxID=97084 RepID=A0A1Y5FFJ8_9BACT|nr:hypothetical protein A9Q84_06980 [Halobacteriovorax marinus]
MSKILVVDDSMVIRKMIKNSLQKEGHEIHQAENGQEGFELFAAHSFDLIITDINMPIMNGFEFSEKVRASSGTSCDIPIIVLSTEFSDEVKERGRNIGINAWMVKPAEEEKLLKAVAFLIENTKMKSA